MQIVPDVYQLKIPLPDRNLTTLNAYVIKTDEGSILVDTGWNTKQAYEALISQLAEIDLTPADLKYVVITHFHPDHSGLVNQISKESDAVFIQHTFEHELLNKRRQDSVNVVESMENWLIRNGLPVEINNELRDMSQSIYK